MIIWLTNWYNTKKKQYGELKQEGMLFTLITWKKNCTVGIGEGGGDVELHTTNHAYENEESRPFNASTQLYEIFEEEER